GPVLTAGRSRVDYSYLVLRTTGVASTDPTLYRIVSDRLRDKGRLRLYGCGPAGRHELVRLDRDASDANAALDDTERGDVIVVEGTRAVDSVRVARFMFRRRSRRGT